jgi:hypothetical protein
VDVNKPKSKLWDLLEPVQFQHEVNTEVTPAKAAAAVPAGATGVRWNARVGASRSTWMEVCDM